jgi:signal-transduction protein with cAMP-binding, CBS, and nucleotidyltransferase domain
MTDSRPTQLTPRVDDLGLRPVVTVPREASLAQAARVMRAHDISSLVVGRPGDLISIVTERDLTQGLADGRDCNATVEAVASPQPVTVSPDASAVDAAAQMLRHGVRHLVVVRGRHAVGVISMRDVLAALVAASATETMVLMFEQLRFDPS